MEDSHRDMILMSGARHVMQVLETIERQIIMDERYAQSQALYQAVVICLLSR